MKRPWWEALILLSVLLSTVCWAKEKSSCTALLQRDPALATWSDTRLKWAIKFNHFQSWWSGESRDLAVPLVRYLNEAVARQLYTVQDVQDLLHQKASRGNYWAQPDVQSDAPQGWHVLDDPVRKEQVNASWQAWADRVRWPTESKAALLQWIQDKTMFLAQAQLMQKQLPSEISFEDAQVVLSYLHYAFSLIIKSRDC